MKRIQFIISGLGGGGAERMLLKLLSRIDRDFFEPKVISLTEYGEISRNLANKFENIGVPVRFLGMRQGVPDPRGILKLSKWLWDERPDLVQTWMYHADLIGGIAAKMARRLPVIWNIRHSDLRPGVNKRTTIWTAKACSRLSYVLPERIICCGLETRNVHQQLGYDQKKLVVVQNGFDTEIFYKRPEARDLLLKEFDIPVDNVVIGMVARYDLQKDHINLIEAANILLKNKKNVTFVLCGDEINFDNRNIMQKIEQCGIRKHFRLLGHRNDIPEIISAFDIATSTSSCGEGFPNSVGEAMACETVCVVTNVGDSAYIVGNFGKVVPPMDPNSLAASWLEMVQMEKSKRLDLGVQARKRILQEFSLDIITQKYEKIYCEVLGI